MKHIWCISALLASSCYGMDPFHSNEIGNLNNQPYRYITVDNKNISAPIMNEENAQFTQQNVTSANISDDNDSSEDEVIQLNQNNKCYTHTEDRLNMVEEYTYEEQDVEDYRHNDTYSTPTDIDYPTTPTSEETSIPSYLMSED